MIAHRIGGTTGAKAAPTKSDMAAIQKLALRPMAESEIAVFTIDAAHTMVDMDDERFEYECLEDFAASANEDHPLLLENHDWGGSSSGSGRVFDAWTEKRGDVGWLVCKVYCVLSDPDSAKLASRIASGLCAFNSIGFSCPTRTATYENGKQINVYSRGANGEPCTLLEISAVFRGAQPGARPVKAMLAAMSKGLQDRIRKSQRSDFSYLLRATS